MTPEINRKDAAVSETVGYIYVLAIVAISMSLIYAMGYPALQSSMDASTFESAEQSFIVLQSNMKTVAFNQVSVKNLNFQLQGSTLSVTENSNITIDHDGETQQYVCGEIEYQKKSSFLTYENGGVWKRYPNGITMMVSRPSVYISTMNGTNITTIGVVSAKGTSSVGGKGIVTLKMQHNKSIINQTLKTGNVTLRINSTYAPEWKKYLESIDFTITNSTDSSLIANRNNTMLVVGHHLVDVDIT